MRRQNHSCDQCRKAKRACDAPSLREAVARRGSVTESCRSGSLLSDDNESDYAPCSYCVKTNKHCTLNWARSQLQAAQNASASRTGEHRRARRHRASVTTNASGPATAVGTVGVGNGAITKDQPAVALPSPVFPSPARSSTVRTTSEAGDCAVPASIAGPVDMAFWGPAHPMFHETPALDTFSMQPSEPSGLANSAGLPPLDFGESAIGTGNAGLLNLPFDDMPVVTSELVSRPAFHHMTSDQLTLWGMGPSPAAGGVDVIRNQAAPFHGLSPPEVFSVNGEEEEDDSPSSVPVTVGYSLHRPSLLAPHRVQTTRRPSGMSIGPSGPGGIEFMMATRVNNNFISSSLLQIYHDVLEHNLTCWITEETCPYNVWARPAKQKRIQEPINQPSGSRQPLVIGGRPSWAPPQDHSGQFGAKWTNRVYQRVTKLDKIAQKAGIMKLTRAQSQASQKALHLVIMAFATQWAQGSQRQREAYTSGFPSMNYAATEEFDRSIQRSLWYQARQILQDCADIESYRVVCAELIFSITQRPWEEDEFAELELATSTAQNGNGTSPSNHESNRDVTTRKREAILEKLVDVLSKDGPPTFVERAARKMHTLKFTFDNYELGFLGETSNSQDVTDLGADNGVASEDGQTVGLLFWMAVMFDTITASMTERPVVLADDASQHEAAEHDHMFPEGGARSSNSDPAASDTAPTRIHSHPINVKKNNRWRIDLFIQDDPERMSQSQYHYPCSYDEAARTITRAVPVKVLLYRQVLYLQNMLRKPYLTKGEPVEELIKETLMIYRYWNLTYGAFFRELIEHYSTVPSRIRGWFVCILSHWHLGALMLADVVEMVDNNCVGLESLQQMRQNARTVACIRRSSAMQLADLARIATPLMAEAETDPTMPDFHFAVREGTILTEPWTMLLIRAFSRAAIIHLREADGNWLPNSPDLLGHEGEAYRTSLRRCEECIQALWYLGKKSDVARNTAVVLFKALNV